ncbi:TetR/AcrR family transcriptional regulator [Corynebacterium anserum]|uniref:TetR family transcriptional regulator n=1 Tax=Corynebacterium anserum TaxID=2684406 RepID=A0A7G7YLQ8_9CORY|nr:TetR/AcrR family transcriptional regulator [Corynebacterium anserum]MBC2681407.1 TetR family transcriptional regulator [Corynebacterium anserum]QNH95428.1 TetR family transcriptional regulator [Corynebacterium anserum]
MGRREEIIEAARSIMAEAGIEAMSVRNVAARAGIGASTLRYYFPSHQELLDAVASDAMIGILQDCRIHDQSLPADERLIECLAQFLPIREEQHASLETLLAAYASCFDHGKLVGNQHLRTVISQGTTQIIRWLTILQSEGQELRSGPETIAEALIIHLDGITLRMISMAPDFTHDDALTHLKVIVDAVLVTLNNNPESSTSEVCDG